MSAQQALPGPDTIQRVQLANGITVLAYHNPHVQSALVTGAIRTGAHHEDPWGQGLASVMIGSLLRGTQARDFDAIHGALENIGAELRFSTGGHTSSFFGKSLAEDLPVVVELLADALRHPSFPRDQVERRRGEMITRLRYSQQDTRYRASRSFNEALYPATHPYHHPSGGSIEGLEALEPGMVAAFHASQVGPRDMIVVVVGAVPTAQAIDLVTEHLGDWANPAQAAAITLPDLPPITSQTERRVHLAGKTQSDLKLGVRGPSRAQPDYLAANLANSILGEFGMMGRVGQVIREELGLAYYAYSRLDGGLGPGAWSITAGVAPENVDLTIERARAEIQRLVSKPVSADDLSDNQSYVTGRLPLRLENNEGIASALWLIELHELGLDYLQRFAGTIHALTTDDLLAAARNYWDPERLVIAVAGPETA
jgi:zinc protease